MGKYLFIALVFAASSAVAQKVPELDKNAPEMIMPVMPVSVSAPMGGPSPAPALNDKEQAALRLVRQWKDSPDKPRRSADGSVKYLFGATLPTMICTPLQVCAIRLQAGEVVNDVHVGDAARWKVTPSTIGAGPGAITNVIVKPTDSGLLTNLIITTDRRSYTIKLLAAKHEWIPSISFDYPDDVAAEWAAYKKKEGRAVYASTLATGENAANLDFNFQMSGDNPKWKPIRVYATNKQTYIQFASDMFSDEAPALVVLGKDGGIFRDESTQLVNYRLIGDRYVVDGLPDRFALISGVGGSQTKVIIDRVGRKQ